MAHMRVFASRFAAYHVETECGTEVVPEDVCGALDTSDALTPYETVGNLHKLESYLEGSRVEGVERKEGWYARLSAPGYMDCTPWTGPYASESKAVAVVCKQYDCDENGRIGRRWRAMTSTLDGWKLIHLGLATKHELWSDQTARASGFTLTSGLRVSAAVDMTDDEVREKLAEYYGHEWRRVTEWSAASSEDDLTSRWEKVTGT